MPEESDAVPEIAIVLALVLYVPEADGWAT